MFSAVYTPCFVFLRFKAGFLSRQLNAGIKTLPNSAHQITLSLKPCWLSGTHFDFQSEGRGLRNFLFI